MSACSTVSIEAYIYASRCRVKSISDGAGGDCHNNTVFQSLVGPCTLSVSLRTRLLRVQPRSVKLKRDDT